MFASIAASAVRDEEGRPGVKVRTSLPPGVYRLMMYVSSDANPAEPERDDGCTPGVAVIAVKHGARLRAPPARLNDWADGLLAPF